MWKETVYILRMCQKNLCIQRQNIEFSYILHLHHPFLRIQGMKLFVTYLLLVRSYSVHHVGGLQTHLGAVVVGRLSASVVRLSCVLYRLSTRARYFNYLAYVSSWLISSITISLIYNYSSLIISGAFLAFFKNPLCSFSDYTRNEIFCILILLSVC